MDELQRSIYVDRFRLIYEYTPLARGAGAVSQRPGHCEDHLSTRTHTDLRQHAARTRREPADVAPRCVCEIDGAGGFIEGCVDVR